MGLSDRTHVRKARALAMVLGLVASVTVTIVLPASPAVAEVTEVKGEACAYYTNVGLFGGPQNLRGCDQTSGGATSASPKVTLPPEGSAEPITASDPDGARGVYGPATIHGGKWPCEDPGVDEDGDGFPGNCPLTAPPSGPQNVSTQGTTGEGGSVTSSAEIGLDPSPDEVPCWEGWGPVCVAQGGFGPFPVQGDSLKAECTANESGVSGSTTFSKAELAVSTDAEGNPVEFETVPDEPPVNYTRSGVITNVGDVFTVVYNEQIQNADGSLTVNAVHMYLFGPVAVGEVVRGQVTCGTTPSATPQADTLAPICGAPVVAPMGPEDPTPKVPLEVLIGVFDAGGLESITDVQATNGTVQVGKDAESGALPYLTFVPGQKGPLPISVVRTDEGSAMSFSFVATDAAGNVREVSVDVSAGGVPTSQNCPSNSERIGTVKNDPPAVTPTGGGGTGGAGTTGAGGSGSPTATTRPGSTVRGATGGSGATGTTRPATASGSGATGTGGRSVATTGTETRPLVMGAFVLVVLGAIALVGARHRNPEDEPLPVIRR